MQIYSDPVHFSKTHLHKITKMTPPNQPTFDEVFKKRIVQLERDARDVGLNLTSVCKLAGISRATPDRWKRKAPATIEIVTRMDAIIAEHRESLEKAEKNT